MKNILISVLIMFIVHTSSYASNFALSMKLKEADRVGSLVDRVNNIYEYINYYVLHYGDLSNANATRARVMTLFLENEYLWKNYDDSDFEFSFDADQNIRIEHVMLSAHSLVLKRMFEFNPKLNPFATVDFTTPMGYVTIPLPPKTKTFLRKLTIVQANSRIIVSVSRPAISDKIWYKPDGKGGFFKYRQKNLAWIGLEDMDMKIHVVDTPVDRDGLSDIRKGDIVYVGIMPERSKKYVYDGTQWLKSNKTSSVSNMTGICDGAHTGSMRYSIVNDYMEYCDGSSNWVQVP